MNKEKEFSSLNDVNSDIYILSNAHIKDYIDKRLMNCKINNFKNDTKLSGSIYNIFNTARSF